MTSALSWVVGSGGLLGTNVEAALARRGTTWRPEHRIPWGTPGAPARITAAVHAFAAASAGAPWQVAWCAGAGVPSSPPEALAADEAVVEHFLSALAEVPGPGTLFLASSAGGVYGGSSGPPFTELTEPVPLGGYGRSRLQMEAAAARWGRSTGRAVVIGRLSNLYGVGQDLSKPQGLVSHLCRAQLRREPVQIYVSFDTVRDYLWAGDAGELVARVLVRAAGPPDGGGGDDTGPVVTKILASGVGTTVGELVGELRRVGFRPPPVVHAPSAASAWQARDLRLRSRVWEDVRVPLTPLPVGVSSVLRHLMRLQQQGRLA